MILGMGYGTFYCMNLDLDLDVNRGYIWVWTGGWAMELNAINLNLLQYLSIVHRLLLSY